MHDRYTLHQARGRLVAGMLAEYEAADLAGILQRVDPSRQVPAGASRRQLAHKIAWSLLPARVDKAAESCDLSAVLSAVRQGL